MITLKTAVSTTYEVKKSSFITTLFPYQDFNTVMEYLRMEHPKGRHFVSAYRYFNEHMQVVEGSSDDGEPKGTSGKPMLNVLRGDEIINVGAITVRYFGGIKLGTGGLVRAYTDAVRLALDSAVLNPYVHHKSQWIEVVYSDLSRVEYLAEKELIVFIERQFGADGVQLHCKGEEKALERFLLRI